MKSLLAKKNTGAPPHHSKTQRVTRVAMPSIGEQHATEGRGWCTWLKSPTGVVTALVVVALVSLAITLPLVLKKHNDHHENEEQRANEESVGVLLDDWTNAFDSAKTSSTIATAVRVSSMTERWQANHDACEKTPTGALRDVRCAYEQEQEIEQLALLRQLAETEISLQRREFYVHFEQFICSSCTRLMGGIAAQAEELTLLELQAWGRELFNSALQDLDEGTVTHLATVLLLENAVCGVQEAC